VGIPLGLCNPLKSVHGTRQYTTPSMRTASITLSAQNGIWRLAASSLKLGGSEIVSEG
jgi:hypothetical protein